MQKCCRDPLGLIHERSRAQCTVQLAKELLWGEQFYCHYSAVICLDVTSFQGFLQTNVDPSRTRDLCIGKSGSVLGGDPAWLERGSREGMERHEANSIQFPAASCCFSVPVTAESLRRKDVNRGTAPCHKVRERATNPIYLWEGQGDCRKE